MPEVKTESVDLIVTSPPYWSIKDYGQEEQIGFGETFESYLHSLDQVWSESLRVLKPGRRLCVNIGDQFTRTSEYGRYKVIPIHAHIIIQCETLGMDYMGSIIWQKKTTMNPSGGASVMGSYPNPPNGIVELDYEYILLFKKMGKAELPDNKTDSSLTKEEWRSYFQGHWNFSGSKQNNHIAKFPEELPRRLIKMFSFKGETVLDPFMGSGTTAKAAHELGRSAIGYEIKEDYIHVIRKTVEGDNIGLWAPETFYEKRS